MNVSQKVQDFLDRYKTFDGADSIAAYQRDLMLEFDLNFHPDTDFSDYVTPENTQLFTAEDAEMLNEQLQRAFKYCEQNGIDIYELGYIELMKIMGIDVNEEFASKKQARYFYWKAKGNSKEAKKWKRMAREYSDSTNWEDLPESHEPNVHKTFESFISSKHRKINENRLVINPDYRHQSWAMRVLSEFSNTDRRIVNEILNGGNVNSILRQYDEKAWKQLLTSVGYKMGMPNDDFERLGQQQYVDELVKRLNGMLAVVESTDVGRGVNAEDLVVGKIYKTPSNMGGSFNVEYTGMSGGLHRFKNVTKGWEDGPNSFYSFGPTAVKNLIFNLDQSIYEGRVEAINALHTLVSEKIALAGLSDKCEIKNYSGSIIVIVKEKNYLADIKKAIMVFKYEQKTPKTRNGDFRFIIDVDVFLKESVKNSRNKLSVNNNYKYKNTAQLILDEASDRRYNVLFALVTDSNVDEYLSDMKSDAHELRFMDSLGTALGLNNSAYEHRPYKDYIDAMSVKAKEMFIVNDN